jgi:hypothetical protein
MTYIIVRLKHDLCLFFVYNGKMGYTACAMPFNIVQWLVCSIVQGKIIVGHRLWTDLAGKIKLSNLGLGGNNLYTLRCILMLDSLLVLGVVHPMVNTRDMKLYQPFIEAYANSNTTTSMQAFLKHIEIHNMAEPQHRAVGGVAFDLSLICILTVN